MAEFNGNRFIYLYLSQFYLSIYLSILGIQSMIYLRMPSISFQTFFVQAFKIVIDTWEFNMLLLYTLWDDWPIFMISGSKEQLQQQLECALLKPDCHGWWISKIQSGREDTFEERYAIQFYFKRGKNATETYCFSTNLHESSISFWVAWEIQRRQGVCEEWWEVLEE